MEIVCVNKYKLSLGRRLGLGCAATAISASGLIELLAQILPVVDHDLLDGEEGLVSDVGVLVRQMMHHHLFTAQFVHHVLPPGVMSEDL